MKIKSRRMSSVGLRIFLSTEFRDMKNVQCEIFFHLCIQRIDNVFEYRFVEYENGRNLNDCLKDLMEKYFENSTFVSIISDGQLFLPKGKTVMIRNMNRFSKPSFSEPNVVICVKQISFEDILKNVSRTFRTKFIVIIEEENVSKITQIFSKLKFFLY